MAGMGRQLDRIMPQLRGQCQKFAHKFVCYNRQLLQTHYAALPLAEAAFSYSMVLRVGKRATWQ